MNRIQIIARICWATGLTSLFYFLNRNRKRILTFHNVLPDALWRSSLANGVSCTESAFRAIVSECAKRFSFSTDLFDARTMTITFDDGYRNQYSTAFPILRQWRIPAYLFVARVARGDVLNIDKLLHWVAEVPSGSYEFSYDGSSYTISLTDRISRSKAWREVVWPLFCKDAPSKGARLIEAVNAAYPLDDILSSLPEAYRESRLGAILDSELEEMRKAGWRIGWHTKSHVPLAFMPDELIRDELQAPEEYRSECLSFPYGNPVEVGSKAIRIAKEFGFPCAVSNTSSASENRSRYFLPRMSVAQDKYLLHFGLSGLKYFAKHGKLLPMSQ